MTGISLALFAIIIILIIWIMRLKKEVNRLPVLRIQNQNTSAILRTLNHHWKQYLNNLGFLFIQMAQALDELDESDALATRLNQIIEKGENSLQTLSDSLDAIKTVAQPDTNPQRFNVSDATESIVLLLRENFTPYQLSFDDRLPPGFFIEVKKIDFNHALLYLLLSVNEALQINAQQQEGLVLLTLSKTPHQLVLEIKVETNKPLERLSITKHWIEKRLNSTIDLAYRQAVMKLRLVISTHA